MNLPDKFVKNYVAAMKDGQRGWRLTPSIKKKQELLRFCLMNSVPFWQSEQKVTHACTMKFYSTNLSRWMSIKLMNWTLWISFLVCSHLTSARFPFAISCQWVIKFATLQRGSEVKCHRAKRHGTSSDARIASLRLIFFCTGQMTFHSNFGDRSSHLCPLSWSMGSSQFHHTNNFFS